MSRLIDPAPGAAWLRPTRFRLTLLAIALVLTALLAPFAASGRAADPVVDLERAGVAELEQMMSAGQLTSVQLARMYVNRIAALNTRAAGLNAVRGLNPKALEEAAALDAERAAGKLRGPLHGIPVLVKDNLDLVGMPTTAGSVALEHSFPASDSTVVAKLKASGAVILGKTNLTEFANYLANGMPGGYSSLGGQVLNPYDTTLSPRGSSSGSGVAAAAGLATLTIGTETSGSIIGPATASGDVGLRPTIGLVSRTGIVPISASQDTAGPITKTVPDAAVMLQSIAGTDSEDPATTGDQPGSIAPPPTVPDYVGGLDAGALDGARIAVVADPEATYQAAIDAVEAAGATTEVVPTPVPSGLPPAILDFEFERDLNHYLSRLPDSAPMDTMDDIIAYNEAHPEEALKFGQGRMLASDAKSVEAHPELMDEYEEARDEGMAMTREAIDDALANGTADSGDDFDAIMTPSGTLTGTGARAGYPQLTLPAGYTNPGRSPINISFVGTAYSEAELLKLGYAFEQATHVRRTPSEMNTNLYRCAQTSPPSPYSGRGDCNPAGELLSMIGAVPNLPFSLEEANIPFLEKRLQQRTLTSLTLTKAYLARIAYSNGQGPTTNAVRAVNPNALAEAEASDARRANGEVLGPLEGMPILLKDNVDVVGMPTTAGSIALQHSLPASDAPIVEGLKEAGAIILGKANLNEFAGYMSDFAPSGYSTLGGQVLNPYNSLVTPRGSSNGSAVAAATGLAAATIGTDTLGSIISPSVANGVVGLRPTQGLVSRTGIVPISMTQDMAGPITKTVADAAATLAAIAGPDPEDPATSGGQPGSTPQPPVLPDYMAALDKDALDGAHIAAVESTTYGYAEALEVLEDLGADVEMVPAPTGTTAPSILTWELKRDMNHYLSRLPADAPVKTLQGIIDYNSSHSEEALMFGQELLTDGEAVDLDDPTTEAEYEAAREQGIEESREAIDEILENGTPGDESDDFEAIFFPNRDLRAFGSIGGYPVLTVPSGYNPSAGREPVNMSFISDAYTEDTLIGFGYAYEQATHLWQPPSQINPAMWRCVPGGAFGPRSCPPGEFLAAPEEPVVPPTPPAPPAGKGPDKPKLGKAAYRAKLSAFLGKGLKITVGCGGGLVRLTAGVAPGVAKSSGLLPKAKPLTLARAAGKCAAGKAALTLKPTARARKALSADTFTAKRLKATLIAQSGKRRDVAKLILSD